MDRRGSIWFLLMIVLIGGDDICKWASDIPRTLCRNIFPNRVLNPRFMEIFYHIPNTTCFYRRHLHSLIITSNSYHSASCDLVPSNTSNFNFSTSIKYITDVAIENTIITQLEKGIFQTWFGAEILHITMNYHLQSIQPGAFTNLTKVWNLTISDNPNLGPLEEETFKGLVNLRELRYLRNNVIRLNSVTPALCPLFLPAMAVLIFTGNTVRNIYKDDFVPLTNSKIHTLVIRLAKIEWIHEDAFDPLSLIVSLNLGRNNLNSSVLTPLLNRMVKKNKKLTHLVVGGNVLQSDNREFLNAVAQNGSNIYYLDLRENHLGSMDPGFFPQMPIVKYLVLSNVMVDDMLDGVITYDLMPNLKTLFLGKNIFSGLKSSMVTKTINQLYLSDNDNNLPWTSYFNIDSQVFLEMPDLEILDLKGNTLNILFEKTFHHAKSLKILILKQTTLYEVKEGAFETNGQLLYLDLSSNFFPVVNPFRKDIFRGLDNLKALDLSDCQISSIAYQDVFVHLKNLQYLSLRKNSIRQISPTLFATMKLLVIIDLRFNILVSWNERIFKYNNKMNYTLLDYNHIQTITDAMLSDFLMSRVVALYSNTIICDCKLMNTVAKVIKSGGIEDVKKLPFSDEMNTCINQQGKTLSDFLSMVNSARCINKEWVIIVSAITVTVLITSFIAYIIYYYYKYDIHFWFLRSKRRLGLLHYIGSKNRENPGDFKYDAFVSYCNEDEKFVEKMVYILEKDCSKLNLCVYERDFKVGDVLTDRILHCMESSRRTILVLTEAFAKSQWCCWEMYIAQSRSISLRNSDPNDPLILIKKSDIPEALMTPTLKYLMKTRVYLEWHDSPVRQKIFWEQLKNALKTKRVVLDTNT